MPSIEDAPVEKKSTETLPSEPVTKEIVALEPVTKEIVAIEPVTKEIPKSEESVKPVEDITEPTQIEQPPAPIEPTVAAQQDTEISSSATTGPAASDDLNGASTNKTTSENCEKVEDKDTSEVEKISDSTTNGVKVDKTEEVTEENSVVDSTKDKPELNNGVSSSDQAMDEAVVESKEEVAPVSENGKDEVPIEVTPVDDSPAKQEAGDSKAASSEVDISNDVKENPKDSKEVEIAEEKSADIDVNSEASAKTDEKIDAKTDNAELTKNISNETDEKMETSEPQSSDSSCVTGSDQVENKPVPIEANGVTCSDEDKPVESSEKDNPKKEETSADSTSEQKPEDAAQAQPSSSSTVEPQADALSKIEELRNQGLSSFVQRKFFEAADAFGKVLELQAPLYGEMSEKLAETYFLYGSSMYEYGKTENTVLGEKVKEQDENEDDDAQDETENEEAENDGEDKMEVEEEAGDQSPEDESSSPSDEKPNADESLAETTTAEEKEDDDSFRVAWEMLELAKATFMKGDSKKRLADTLMKLGEVGIETGNVEAISEMVESLKVRQEIYAADHRIIPETHFHIGVAYAFFEKYDDAVQHFTNAKSCLEKRIESLSKSEGMESSEEIDEIRKIIPEIQDKIQDTLESQADKAKLKEKQESSTSTSNPFAPTESSKPATNISHLIKRKRNVDDILPERAAKQSRQEETKSTEPPVEPVKPSDSEPEKSEDPVKKPEETPKPISEITPDDSAKASETTVENAQPMEEVEMKSVDDETDKPHSEEQSKTEDVTTTGSEAAVEDSTPSDKTEETTEVEKMEAN